MDDIYKQVLWGIAGGVLAQFIELWKFRENAPEELPKFLKSFFYWAMTIIMVLIGGFLVYIYNITGSNLSTMLAINIGATAPLLISELTSKNKKIDE
jgi:hypothetical protein